MNHAWYLQKSSSQKSRRRLVKFKTPADLVGVFDWWSRNELVPKLLIRFAHKCFCRRDSATLMATPGVAHSISLHSGASSFASLTPGFTRPRFESRRKQKNSKTPTHSYWGQTILCAIDGTRTRNLSRALYLIFS